METEDPFTPPNENDLKALCTNGGWRHNWKHSRTNPLIATCMSCGKVQDVSKPGMLHDVKFSWQGVLMCMGAILFVAVFSWVALIWGGVTLLRLVGVNI